MSFQPLKRDCPICQGARRDCRQNAASGLIHCRDAEANPEGFRYIGDDKLGFGMWAAGDADQQRPERQPAKQKPKTATLLPIEERNRQFRAIAKHSGYPLNQHQRKLEAWRLSHLICANHQKGLLWSWQSGERIAGTSSDLPGIDQKGKLRKFSGLAIGIPNPRGHILGVQIKPDGGSSYRWVSSERIGGNSIHLPDGEMPTGFYHPSCGNISTRSLCLAAGFLKPLIIAERHHQLVIGAAGGN